MKKVLSIFIILAFCLTLCSCAYSADGIKSNLSKSGYSVLDLTEEEKTDLNNELKYSYKGSGSIINAFYAVDYENKESITVLEFQNKSDLTIMYKLVKESLDKGQSVDLSGYILVYGSENGVKAALNK
ncbi:MAG: hypothetical protein E7565_04920 [Ruminococcaceae bacterium]|nr:hypothetical protein [Oscillospiraceae bacterium]